MKRENVIKQLKRMKMDKSHTGDEYNAICEAIKSLEQEPVLDKIKAEIVELPTISFNANDVYKADVLQIIDKYREESEE